MSSFEYFKVNLHLCEIYIITAMSTTEALYAATEAVKDSKMIENLFQYLLPEVSIPTPELFCNQAVVRIKR